MTFRIRRILAAFAALLTLICASGFAEEYTFEMSAFFDGLPMPNEPLPAESSDAEKIGIESADAGETDAVPNAARKIARVRAVGDFMSTKHQRELAARGGGVYDYKPQFAEVRDLLSAADFTVGNLETPVNPHSAYTESTFPNFNSPAGYLDALKDCGVDFVTLANNHMNDNNFEGLAETIRQLDSREILHGGAYANLDDADETVVVEINGIRIGMLCYTTLVNRMPKKKYNASIAMTSNRDLAKDVRALRDQNVDIIICMIHWGEEYVMKPNNRQKKIAEAIVNAGVDIIIGSHPHVLQPVETKTIKTGGESRKVLIAWSLGNFIGNQRGEDKQNSMILDFTLVKENGKATFYDVGYIPTFTLNRSSYVITVPSEKYKDERLDQISADDFDKLRSGYQKTVKMMADFKRFSE